MSRYLRKTRERWAAREMVVKTWFKQAGERTAFGEPICELTVDGRPMIIAHEDPVERMDVWGIYRHFMNTGDEVGPWGELFEFSDTGSIPLGPLHDGAPRRFNYRRRESYPLIFLNYRRQDSEAYAGRLHEVLSRQFGLDQVFMDQFSVRGGEVAPWTIQQAVAHCRVVIALIGPNYLPVDLTKRSFDHLHDYVRREITAALDRGTTIVPVLLPGASVTTLTANLPAEMRGLELYQMLELSVRHWQAGVDDIVDAIASEVR